MSRSYKHNPICKDNNCSKRFRKQQANRRVRRMLKNPEFEIRPKSNDHRQLTESWEISDYTSRWSEAQAIDYYFSKKAEAVLNNWRAEIAIKFLEDYPTLESWLIDWKKMMLRK